MKKLTIAIVLLLFGTGGQAQSSTKTLVQLARSTYTQVMNSHSLESSFRLGSTKKIYEPKFEMFAVMLFIYKASLLGLEPSTVVGELENNSNDAKLWEIFDKNEDLFTAFVKLRKENLTPTNKENTAPADKEGLVLADEESNTSASEENITPTNFVADIWVTAGVLPRSWYNQLIMSDNPSVPPPLEEKPEESYFYAISGLSDINTEIIKLHLPAYTDALIAASEDGKTAALLVKGMHALLEEKAATPYEEAKQKLDDKLLSIIFDNRQIFD